MYPKAPLDQQGPPWRSPLTGKFVDEVSYDTHVSDVQHIRETLKGLQNPEPEGEGFGPCGERSVAVPGAGTVCNYPDCDCFHSETVMLSSGYAEIFQDGEVVQYGRVIWKEE